MKKILLLSLTLVSNTSKPAISEHDIMVGGCSAAAAAIVTFGISSYWQQAALERDKIAAEQADKRAKEQTEREEKQKEEQLQEKRTTADIRLHQISHYYNPEVDALLHKGLSKNRKHFETIVQGKQVAPNSRFQDWAKTACTDISSLTELSPHLSPEQKKLQTTLITQLHEIIRIFNTFFAEDADAERSELKKIEYQDKMARLQIEKAELENKKLRTETEAQKASIENNELLKNLSHDIHVIKQDCSRTERKIDSQTAALKNHINLTFNAIKEAFAAGNVHLEQYLHTLFTKKMDEATKKVQDALQNQAAPQVVLQQVQPPYNPAAVSVVSGQAPSEAVDVSAMPASNPPPSYT